MPTGQRGTEKQFNRLHQLVTTEYIRRLSAEDIELSDLRAAAEWCIKNDVNAPTMDGNTMDSLRKLVPTIDPSSVKSRVHS